MQLVLELENLSTDVWRHLLVNGWLYWCMGFIRKSYGHCYLLHEIEVQHQLVGYTCTFLSSFGRFPNKMQLAETHNFFLIMRNLKVKVLCGCNWELQPWSQVTKGWKKIICILPLLTPVQCLPFFNMVVATNIIDEGKLIPWLQFH